MDIQFQAKYLPMLAPFMATNDIRYYLNGIHVQPYLDGVLLTATDGHTLAMVYDKEGTADRPAIFKASRPLIAAARKAKENNSGKPWVMSEAIPDSAQPERMISTVDGNAELPSRPTQHRMKVVQGNTGFYGLEIYVQPGAAEIDGRYPNPLGVVPRREDLQIGAPFAYNPRFLARLPVPSRRDFGVKFHSAPLVPGRKDAHGYPDASVLVCEMTELPEFMALIMPLRATGEGWSGEQLPAWWQVQPAAAQQQAA